MAHYRIRMDVTERTKYAGVSAVVNLPDDIGPGDGNVIADWLRANPEAWNDALIGTGGLVFTDGIEIEDVRPLE
jgi:hypothetical protein